MTLYTHTPEQHAQLKAIRERLKELGDTKTAAMLDWVSTAVPNEQSEVLSALLELARQFPTDSDLYECGWTRREVDAACNAHERAVAVIGKHKKES